MIYAVLDNGLFTDLANALADGGKNEVLYHTGWQDDPFPKLQDFAPGTGYEHLTKVTRLTEIDYDEVDCIVAFDVSRNDEIVALKQQYPEKSIVGSGKGEVLEEDREGMKKRLKALGLDVHPYVVVKGVEALEAYLKDHPNVFVKINIFRRSLETVQVRTYEESKKDGLFTDILAEFGPVFSQTVKFIVEDAIESECEIGFDGFFTPGGSYLNKAFLGYEYKKGPYLAKVVETDELPEPIAETMEAFDPVLSKMDYRGPLSVEEKILPDGHHYVLDWCSRLLAPGSSLYPYAIKNWTELIYDIGLGEEAEVDIDARYVGALPLASDVPAHASKYIHLVIDPEYRDRIRPQSVCSDGKDLYAVKGSKGVAVVVAKGESVEEVIDSLKESARHVRFEGMNEDEARVLDVFPDLIEQGEACGIDFT